MIGFNVLTKGFAIQLSLECSKLLGCLSRGLVMAGLTLSNLVLQRNITSQLAEIMEN